MSKVLISIDWDYFIRIEGKIQSLRENYRNIYLRWYKEYLLDPEFCFQYGIFPEPENFWPALRRKFSFNTATLLFLSESHKYSYYLSKILGCDKIISFDAHSDLGYGSVLMSNYYTNCGNWLGKLIDQHQIGQAIIVYSPFTKENAAAFGRYIKNSVVRFTRLTDLVKQKKEDVVAGIHICRSGAWTPPWYDEALERFIKSAGFNGKRGLLKKRRWEPGQLTYSEVMDLLVCS